MASPAPLARDVIDAFADHLSLPKSFARQVLAALKAADRIDSGRPICPPMTPQAIVRTLLGLASPTIKDAVRHGATLGSLPLFSGDGQPTLEVALTDMVEEAAGWRNGETDFRDGKVIVGDGVAHVGDGIYRGEAPGKGLNRYISIDCQSIASLARDLLPFEKV